jgi:DNA-binding NarL/FixJ family response regulator
MKINVLIADDHTIVRDGLGALLDAKSDIKVIGFAATGVQAVKQVQALRPDVVIMDISMGELNGIDAAERIQELCPEVKVIMLSILGTPEHIYHALKAGARGYLLKESAGREVMDAVLAVQAGKLYLSQPILNILIADYIQVRGQSEKKGPLESLSEREREILQYVVDGKTSAEIADTLFLSPKTVESYRSRMMHKLGVSDIPSLIKLALQEGLT